MNRKHLWGLIPVTSVLLAFIIILIIFWDVIVIRIAPKTVLTTALSDVFSQLDARFRDDPLLILLNSLDPDGRYTADVELNTVNSLLGSVDYDMKIKTNLDGNQLSAAGMAASSDMEFEFDLYLDSEFMAVSSVNLVNEQYYGITYETFAEDIRSIPLLDFFVSDKMLSQWDASVKSVQKQILQDVWTPQIPQISKEDIQKFLLGILTLPCEIEERSISVNNSVLDCHSISYSVHGEQANQFFSDTTFSNDATVTAIFYLYQDILIKAQLTIVSNDQSIIYGLDLGTNPSEGTLCIRGDIVQDGSVDSYMLTVDTQRSEDRYVEIWSLLQTSQNNSMLVGDRSFCFEYQPSSGSMNIEFNKADAPIEIQLRKTENGFQMKTDHLASLIRIFTKNDEDVNAIEQTSCTMRVSKGSQIEKPAYKNIDKWSLEDFWSLLNSVGTLVGIHMMS